MKRNILSLAALASLMAGPELVRSRTHDVAFSYRMGAGFPGDVNRTHPASIMPGLMTPTLASKIRLYGDPCLIDTSLNAYRGILVSDTAVTKIDGILTRPYPTQQTTGGMSSALGAATPPDGPAVIDVIEEGLVMVRCNNFSITPPTKGSAVHIWYTANSGVHVQGGLESVATASNTIAITNAKFNGPPDANGVTELWVWKA